MASLSTRSARIRRSLSGLSIDEVVQVLEVALRDVLTRQLDPDVSINISIEHDDNQSRDLPEQPAWVEKQITQHTPNESADADGILYGRTVSFTGDLKSMTREEAAAAVAGFGGVPHVAVTHRTDVLVLGGDPGAKLELAVRYVANGQAIEIINEPTFLRYLGGATFVSEGRERLATNAELQTLRRLDNAVSQRSLASEGPPPPIASTGTATMVALLCQACGKSWERQLQRGRFPLICPDCRSKGHLSGRNPEVVPQRSAPP